MVNGGVVLLGVVAFGAFALAVSSTPHAGAERRRLARGIRQRADRDFVDSAWLLAATHLDPDIRALARHAADYFTRFWIDTCRSGDRPPRGLPPRLHGNYCGGGGFGPVVDDLDALCYAHDRVYEEANDVEAGRA